MICSPHLFNMSISSSANDLQYRQLLINDSELKTELQLSQPPTATPTLAPGAPLRKSETSRCSRD